MIFHYQPGDTFRDASRLYGIRMSHAQSVIERPDAVEEFRVGDSPTGRLSIRLIESASPPRYLLVAWSESEPLRRRYVHAAWPVPMTIVPAGKVTPFNVLESLCSAAGVRLRVNDDEAVLFRGISGQTTPESVQSIVQMVGDPDDAPRTGVPEGIPSVLGQIAMDINKEQTQYEIGLVYAIQVGRLYELLREADGR